MFSFNFEEQGQNYVIESREFQKIKNRLLAGLTNFGRPWIYAVDGNYRNRGELLLRHSHQGQDLDVNKAADTMANLGAIWGRPIVLHTILENQNSLMLYDGNNHTIKTLGDGDEPRKELAQSPH
jgi:stage V sporulation protein R